jgi:hypothetical protein
VASKAHLTNYRQITGAEKHGRANIFL